MPIPPASAVLLYFDGVLYVNDLPVQAFARHVADQLTADQLRQVIAGMRGFLEGRPELLPPGVDLSNAEDGFQAVEILAHTAGLDPAVISAARRAARVDLAASAWLIDAAAGLDSLLAEIGTRARVVLLVEPGDPAARPVLAAINVTVDDIVDAAVTLAITQCLEESAATPDRLLVVGTSWSEQLALANEAGCTTALIDRYNRGCGAPTIRSADLTGLVEGVRVWLGQETR